jgi:hypothetical protein
MHSARISRPKIPSRSPAKLVRGRACWYDGWTKEAGDGVWTLTWKHGLYWILLAYMLF